MIVASGGMSYPATGSTGDGYAMAKACGHTVTPLRPSLVPLLSADPDCPAMQGLSLRNVTLTLTDQRSGKRIFSELGEMLFTHFGVSGPLVLSASSYMRSGSPSDYVLDIDFKPALDEKTLDSRLLRDFSLAPNRELINSLDRLLPRLAIPRVVARSGIQPDVKVNQLTREQRTALLRTVKDLRIAVSGFGPLSEAIVTSGGVNVREVSPATMESKLVRGLYFAGEVLDVDAFTGGYNLQIAFATGRLAGMSAAKRVI